MEPVQKGDPAAGRLFAGWEETIIWSCLQGVMGRVYANDPKSPTAALALLGDFGFLAGRVDEKFLLALKKDVCRRDFLILVPQNEAWSAAVEACYGAQCRRVRRYAFHKEAAFDLPRLEQLANRLPGGVQLAWIDRHWYDFCRRAEWCRDFVSQFERFEQYAEYGLGVVALREGVPVSGASSYSAWRGGIEVEIDTREDCRRQGLASACAARLILACRRRGWYPSWDAQNPWSAVLARKLGYRFSHEYAAYETFLK